MAKAVGIPQNSYCFLAKVNAPLLDSTAPSIAMLLVISNGSMTSADRVLRTGSRVESIPCWKY